jgi:hypothetical protein
VNAIKSDSSLINLTVTKSQVDDFQLSLRVNRFSAQELQIFADPGIDSASQSIILKQLLSNRHLQVYNSPYHRHRT